MEIESFEDALAAATHADPYPAYARLLATQPFFRDAGGRWIASSAAAVTAVLTDPACRVRPTAEPVPAALVGSEAGAVFGKLARMTDGPAHGEARAALVAALEKHPLRTEVIDGLPCADLTRFCFEAGLHAVASVLGVDPAAASEAAQRFVAALARGDAAAASAAARALGGSAEVIGPLMQTCEATAGLIGNTLVALGRGGFGDVPATVENVLRLDSPVQNTRRYLAGRTTLLGEMLDPGATVLVLLAAANRDPAAREVYSFGIGPHACAGRSLAIAIARAAVHRVVASGVEPARLSFRYRPSFNCRIPLLEAR
jgi:cytochrome P450